MHVRNRQLFFGEKILHLESDCRKLDSVAVLRSLIRILCARLAQIDTEMTEKYAKLGKTATFRSVLYIRYPRKESGSGIWTMIRIGLKS